MVSWEAHLSRSMRSQKWDVNYNLVRCRSRLTWKGLRLISCLERREAGLLTPLPAAGLSASTPACVPFALPAPADFVSLGCWAAPPSAFLALHNASLSFRERPSSSIVLDHAAVTIPRVFARFLLSLSPSLARSLSLSLSLSALSISLSSPAALLLCQLPFSR